MKKKQSITKKVLDDLGFESPRRFVKKQKPNPYNQPIFASRDFTDVFEALRKILKKHARRFEVVEDERSYYLRVPARGDIKAFMLFGVTINTSFVTFHHLALLDKNYDKRFPKALHERRHGQSVLNFCWIDKAKFKLLAKEVERVMEMAEYSGYFDRSPKSEA